MLAIAGLLFVLYPALRPFSDEVTLQGAAAFASSLWIVAHVLAMLGFVLAALGLLGLWMLLASTRTERLAFLALLFTWLGGGLTLPFYGAEAFGLNVVGQEALRRGDAAILALASEIRGGPGLAIFVVGLLLLAVGAILTAAAIWRSRSLARWSGVPLALGFALYLPQFFGNQPIRVAHGALVAVGCLWIALEMWRVPRLNR
jgi:hypothetical protein